MNECKYSNDKTVDGIEHEICTNEELKELNKSSDANIPCMGSQCGKFEKKDDERQGSAGE